MSDVEKAISGLVEDEELLHQQQQQQHHPQHHQQQSTPSHTTNINNYNLQNESGNSLLQKQTRQQQHHQHQQIQPHQQQDSSYLTIEQNNCLSRIVNLIFSTPGLVVMVVVYTLMGAFIFPLLEAPQDITKSAIIAKSREDCLKELWIITEKLNVLYERNWTMLVHEQLRRFEGTIVAATRNMAATATTSSSSSSSSSSGGTSGGYGMATETTTTALGRFGGNNLVEFSDLTATRWSFSEALLYSVTVITTIGHGSLTPRTAGGKIATILYALIGVPLMLMCLSSLGALLAEALQCTYARLCCRWPQYVVDGEGDDEMAAQKPQHNKRAPQRRLSRAEISVEKESHRATKQHLHQCDFQDHQQGINFKNCKYDALIGAAATNHSYDDDYQMCYDGNGTTNTTSTTAAAVANATIKHGHKEDCCQLLQNSPGKFTQHLASCMQLKMSPQSTATAAAAAAPTQQYYQQRPDVMLMTTGHKLSSQQPTTMATACRMVIPTQRFYQNATPAMATYHIVSSASANSSPTHHHHHQAIRHYIVPQQTGNSLAATQHFMAVPTNMVRFQTTPQTTTQQQQQYGNTSSNININPMALPVSGSATVYFPIVTAAGSSQQQQPNTSLTCTMGPATQPLVKYHTIQMPHKHRQQSLSLLHQADLQDNHQMTLDNVQADGDDDVSFPAPPPPPAYQTATVHGIRRAKFLTKPLTHEINTLVHESDISCRHDLSQSSFLNASLEGEQHPTITATTTASVCLPSSTAATQMHCVMLSAEATTTTMTNINNFCGSSMTTASASASASATPLPCSPAPAPTTLTNNTNSNNTIYERRESTSSPLTRVVNITNTNTNSSITQAGVGAFTAAAGVQLPTTSTTAVDIMEDEEEQEQQRLGNCPHGTPSRVPLLTHSSPHPAADKPKSFLNATAASFHRHTLNTFHRSNTSMAKQRKSMIINRKGECNLHIPTKRRNSSTTTICYGDHYETSDDELEGTNMYKLKHLNRPSHAHLPTDKHLNHIKSQDPDDYDNHSLTSINDSAAQIPQVPIIVVLLILTFYVCLGTVIFALWENWSLIDGAYFCFVTLTTIGYGDFVPLKTFQGPEIQLFACCAYLLLGLVLVAMSFSILETQLIWKCKRLAVRLKLAKE